MTQHFNWPILCPELQYSIRTEHLDDVGRQMMRWTCKAERECVPPTRSATAFLDLFETAAERGHVDMCRWLFNASQSWWFSSRLLYGKCLHGEHYALAEWAHSVGLLPGSRHLGDLIITGNLTALQWVVKKHGEPSVPWSIHEPTTSLALVRWLYSTGVGRLAAGGLVRTLHRLPASSAVLEFINDSCLYSHCAFILATIGDWKALDFVRDVYPICYQSMLSQYAALKELHDAHKFIPKGYDLDLRTGEITPIDYSDMPELEETGVISPVDTRLSETPEVW